jgi:hypothetical protein
MINRILKPLAWLKSRFIREDGAVTIEFLVMFPAALLIMFVAGESAAVSIRKTNLDRALEMTIREVRLGIVKNPTAASLRSTICQRMNNPNNCSNDLTLEMNVVNTLTTNMPVPSLTATCVNRSAAINTQPNFNAGAANQLVLVRACYVIDVMFPTSVASATVADSIGTEHRLISTTAFVNEPR